MVFRIIAPSPHLAGFVRDYVLAHFAFAPGVLIPSKPYAPRPEHGITFFVRGRATLVTPAGERAEAPAASVFGQPIERHDIHLSREYLMLRVHLRPGALHRLFRVPLSLFTGGPYADAEAVIGPEVGAVNARLAEAPSHAAMVAIVEDYLGQLISRARLDAHPADAIGRLIEARPYRFSLDWLAGEACLSPRQFRRVFTDRFGVGPRLYSRIARFHHAYVYKEAHPEADWLSVAVAFGYADYQHLARDFRAFAGATPPAWVDEAATCPERVLGLASPGAS